MSMTKKHFKLFASEIKEIEDLEDREKIINFLIPIFRADNFRFSEEKFKDFINNK